MPSIGSVEVGKPTLFTALLLVLMTLGFHAEAKKPKKLVWAGLLRGPLSPKEGRTLEALLIDELDGYDTFRLVDASGNALDRRLLASDAARCAMLKDAGVDLFLNFKHKRAIKKLGQALQVFESRLTSLADYELLHDTLLAKAEAHFQAKQFGAAQRTLENFAALAPKKVPSSKTHSKKFVRLWKKARRNMSPYGRIRAECLQPGCTVQVDGQHLGEAPLLATRIIPGKHYVVARWGHAMAISTVRVAPGKEAEIKLGRKGPTEAARQALVEAASQRTGLEEAESQANRIAKLSGSAGVLLAAVRKDKQDTLLLVSKHSKSGAVEAMVSLRLTDKISAQSTAKNVRTLAAAIFVDKRLGEFKVEQGSAALTTGLLELLYEKTNIIAQPSLPEPKNGEPPKLDVEAGPPPPALTEPVTGASTEAGITEKWWFWAALGGGVAVVAASVAAGVALSSGAPDTTNFIVRLP